MTYPEKKLLRLRMRDELKKLSQTERNSAGMAIAHHLEAWLARSPALRSVGLFISLPDELNTLYLQDVAQKMGIMLFIPWITPMRDMVFVRRDRIKDAYVDADFCYLKPLPANVQSADVQDVSSLSAIFVPGLAFDLKGGRLGRGQGYYDRALSALMSLAPRPLFIGLAMDVQIAAQVPLEEHDIFMDYLCTPSLGLVKIIR